MAGRYGQFYGDGQQGWAGEAGNYGLGGSGTPSNVAGGLSSPGAAPAAPGWNSFGATDNPLPPDQSVRTPVAGGGGGYTPPPLNNSPNDTGQPAASSGWSPPVSSPQNGMGAGISSSGFGPSAGGVNAFDAGGEIPDPGGAIPGDPQDPDEMDNTNTGDPLAAVQKALAFGRTRAGLPADLGQGGQQQQGYLNGGDVDNPNQAPLASPGGNIQSFDDGGDVDNPTTNNAQQNQMPQPPQGEIPPQGQQQRPPGQAMAQYVTGADALPPDQVQALEARVDPQGQMDPASRKLATISAAGDPQSQYGVLQSYRQKFNLYSAAAKAAATGSQQRPANMGAAAQAANQAFAHVPSGNSVTAQPIQGGMRISSKPVGKGKQQSLARGGMVQGFAPDGGDVQSDPPYDPGDAQSGSIEAAIPDDGDGDNDSAAQAAPPVPAPDTEAANPMGDEGGQGGAPATGAPDTGAASIDIPTDTFIKMMDGDGHGYDGLISALQDVPSYLKKLLPSAQTPSGPPRVAAQPWTVTNTNPVTPNRFRPTAPPAVSGSLPSAEEQAPFSGSRSAPPTPGAAASTTPGVAQVGTTARANLPTSAQRSLQPPSGLQQQDLTKAQYVTSPAAGAAPPNDADKYLPPEKSVQDFYKDAKALGMPTYSPQAHAYVQQQMAEQSKNMATFRSDYIKGALNRDTWSNRVQAQDARSAAAGAIKLSLGQERAVVDLIKSNNTSLTSIKDALARTGTSPDDIMKIAPRLAAAGAQGGPQAAMQILQQYQQQGQPQQQQAQPTPQVGGPQPPVPGAQLVRYPSGPHAGQSVWRLPNGTIQPIGQ